jgi:hypothetical protein
MFDTALNRWITWKYNYEGFWILHCIDLLLYAIAKIYIVLLHFSLISFIRQMVLAHFLLRIMTLRQDSDIFLDETADSKSVLSAS